MNRMIERMSILLLTLSVVVLVSGATFLTADSAEASTKWYFFVHPTSSTTPDHYFDLDRDDFEMRDWTGWSCTNCNDVPGHTYDQHRSTDYPLAFGGPIRSAAQGVVTAVVNYQYNQCNVNTGPVFGTYVKIKHPPHGSSGRTYYTTYAHMIYGSPKVAQGASVSLYQHLGDTGDTGNSCGPHLHFGVEQDNEGNWVDPFDKGLMCGFYGSPACLVEPQRLDEAFDWAR